MNPNFSRLREFVMAFGALVAARPGEARLLQEGAPLLAGLVSVDDWLPDEFAQAAPTHYTQYLLHADSEQRFSIVSFVWGPGQSTPIHDHTVWGIIGLLRGAEYSQPYRLSPGDRPIAQGPARRLEPGQVEVVSPTVGDVHQVRNAFDDRVSISIHVYGANIGGVQRSVYLPEGGRKSFVSGYSNAVLPNIWSITA
ncbi:MAG: cysteine dioxygenase [Burkholderiales bacterium]|nr:cysteine dioxygenase [Burkholderiales bacterium]MDE2287355.1 cysteine dioxygenase [Burkholderiales bacterium]MDE2610611.1 cysteine dioxygenase [Burkholderiales bacterium]